MSEDAQLGLTVLRCQVGPYELAMPLDAVREVHRAVAVEPLAGAPPHVAGVVEVRGELLPVLELRRSLGVPTRPISPSDAMVRATVGTRPSLLLVDRAEDVATIPADRLHDAEEVVPGTRFVRGVATSPTGPIVVTDLEAFLSNADLERLVRAIHEREAARTGA